MQDTDRMADIKKRLAEATAGPWVVDWGELFGGARVADGILARSDGDKEGQHTFPVFEIDADSEFDNWDAEFIAHSRQDIEYLIGRMEAAEQALTHIRSTKLDDLLGNVWITGETYANDTFLTRVHYANEFKNALAEICRFVREGK